MMTVPAPSSPEVGRTSAAGGDAHGPFTQAPTVSLPKGGGAITGIGEKFGVNPATGTSSFSFPLGASPGRSGFGPQLTLSYDSGAGNGPFGFGWSLSLPSISRKTDKGLPRYDDADESDVFLISGAEDLVPVLSDGFRHRDTTTAPGFQIDRYRPRVEGLFARIERWTKSTGDVHWRSISRDNVTTLYGRSDESRITSGGNVFSWLISATYDDKGNAVTYAYVPEDGTNVDTSLASERNHEPGTNRYLKRVRYGNKVSRLVDSDLWSPVREWMFEVVFDYDEQHYEDIDPVAGKPLGEQHMFARAAAASPPTSSWPVRPDPFSSQRSTFEVRTYRRCRRVLMFHSFAELGSEPCLVRSTEFDYADLDYSVPVTVDDELAHQGSTRIASFIQSVTQSGFVTDTTHPAVRRGRITYPTYLKKSLPPVEFEYSKAAIHDAVQDIDPESLENLPEGLDGARYQWVDLDGEGVSGILTEQADAWFYKPNLGQARFGPMRPVARVPSLANLAGRRQHLLDLAGDGQLDLVSFDGPTPGFYERTEDEDWEPFRAFHDLPQVSWEDPNLRFVDLDGDGHADVLVTENEAVTWYPSLGEDGFGQSSRVAQPVDEDRGPRVVFADGTQSISLADMCGDGLTDLVRVRNSDVCYWPSLGYGRFGAKVTMDNAPWLDNPEQFDQRRVRLADIDGSGTNDLIYLGRDRVRLYFNESGNRWSDARALTDFPPVDDVTSVTAADLLANGTACLVWSTPLPGAARRPMRYVDLMGGTKPHLLVKSANNLGAETRVEYAASTKFYLADKAAGSPWITRLPFPVHVVERVVVDDRISRNRFGTRYAYHHGYFDGIEREFRGFGLVEQWDSEEIAVLTGDGALPPVDNLDVASNLPPVLTRTWFHTGIDLGREHVSDFFAGLLDAIDVGEYFREPGLTDTQARALLLDDTVLPIGLSDDEEREACRALKGSMLRQEVYALDGRDDATSQERATYPYTVTEQNFTIRLVQPQLAGNRHSVFFTHPGEAITYHYDRRFTLDPAEPEPKTRRLFDPRITHALTLEVDDYGNVLKEAAIGYGRRSGDTSLPLQRDRSRQLKTLVTYTQHRVTNAIDDPGTLPDSYRTPLPCETLTFELTDYSRTGSDGRFQPSDLVKPDPARPGRLMHIFDTEVPYEDTTKRANQRRPIECVRTLYRSNDLTHLLPLEQLEPRALAGESYKLAFTPGLLTQVYQRDGKALMLDPGDVLGGQVADGGGYLLSQDLKADGRFPGGDLDGHWWIPSGRTFLSPKTDDTAAEELAHANGHFFLPHRFHDPFHNAATNTESLVTYDAYDLLLRETCDAVDNRVTVGRRRADGTIDTTEPGNDYRILKPSLVTDPNGNRSQVAFDALGLVVGSAVMGKPTPAPVEGDSLAGFETDLTEALTLDHIAQPLTDPWAVLGKATNRLLYDLYAYQRTADQPVPQPPVVYTMARETHESALAQGAKTKVQHGFSYSDGLGREIQKKIQTEPEKADGVVGPPRWVGSGWTIFNNKGKPVRQYEPFFTLTHAFEFGMQVGVSPILFYDPVQRVVATLHPNNTYEKVVFDPWQQVTWDVNDTVLDDPRTDADIVGYTKPYFDGRPPAPPWETWYTQRQGGALGKEEQSAATKAGSHARTPAAVYFDTLGRPFLTITDNGKSQAGKRLLFATRIDLDIEGNQGEVRDAIEQSGDPTGRIVMRYSYDMLGNRIYQLSMEAGARWMLNDVLGKPIRGWDSRAHTFITDYDPLRRPRRSWVIGADPADPQTELLTERTVYGEQRPDAEQRNLRGKVYLHLDQAGSVTTEADDFKGNSLEATRRLTSGVQYKGAVGWADVDDDHAAIPLDARAQMGLAALEAALTPRLEADTYRSLSTYDALNRPTEMTTPHTPTMHPNVIRIGYNEANLLERVDAKLQDARLGGQAVWTPFVTNVDYDAKGQRVQIDYGNAVSTSYEYDPLTFRLIHLTTRRDPTAFPDDCPTPQDPTWPGCQVQNLRYTYDPAGNITHIGDDAQQTIFFRNKHVEPSADYTYDPMYRLVKATGREHLGQIGQVGGDPIPHSWNDASRVGIDWAFNDGLAMGTYTEAYRYDPVGNILEMLHRGDDPAKAGWSRSYAYDEPSLIEDGSGGRLLKMGNRLSHTTVQGNHPPIERYVHDAHGNMVRMPHLGGIHPAPNMHWDHHDQLSRVDLGGGGTAYYVYDSTGERIRKVWEKPGSIVEERRYLGGVEIYRRRQAGELLVRETLHIVDDKQRVALVETRTRDTRGDDPAPAELTRYQFGNHLGSSCLELDAGSRTISYEEYSPYGSTIYQAVANTEAPKRFRFTSKERDNETGLHYHGARYSAAWLGRWTSCDPLGVESTLNGLVYGRDSPLVWTDPTGLADYNWPKGASFISPANASAVGTLAHAEVLPPVANRINKEGFFHAETEVRTLPGGSKNPGSNAPGEIDLRVTGSTQGNHIKDLKPKGGLEDALPQTQNYALHDDTVLSSKPSNRPITDWAKDALDPVESGNRTYLLSEDPEELYAFHYYRYDKVVPVQPQVTKKPVFSGSPSPTGTSPSGSGGTQTPLASSGGLKVLSNAASQVVPGATEALVTAEATGIAAARFGLPRLASAAFAGAKAPGPAVVGGVVGAPVGYLTEGLALNAGLGKGASIGVGTLGAVTTGAIAAGLAVAAIATAPVTLPVLAAAAIAGGLAGGFGYLSTRAMP